MRIGFLCGALSRQGGGVFEAQLSLAQNLTSTGQDVSVYGMEDGDWSKDKSRWAPLVPHAFPCYRLGGFCYSPKMLEALLKAELEVVHLHSLWLYTSLVALRWSGKTKGNYIVTPHGMLEPWALKNSRIKKQIASFCYERRMLQNARCINAHTLKELADVRKFGLRVPVAIVPNGVDLPSEDANPDLKSASPKVLLFLGRIHPKKGLLNLIQGWGAAAATMRKKNWILAIAGWSQGNFTQELVDAGCQLGLRVLSEPVEPSSAALERYDVAFVGPVFGESKHNWLSRANGFILPSFSEGLPMAILEAWAYKLPVIMTPHCNLPEGHTKGAAFTTETDVEAITNVLHQIAEENANRLTEMGRNGYALVREKFGWRTVANQLTEVYEWMALGGQRPSCVLLD